MTANRKPRVARIAKPPKDGPRVLLYDIETAPALGYTWGKYDQNVLHFVHDWYLLCFAYKWQGTDKIHTISLSDAPGFKPGFRNDKWVATALHSLFDEADWTIAHNGDRFDDRKANQKFLVHGLGPCSPYKTIDTKKVSARYFAHLSNSLKELGQFHELPAKMDTGGFSLWLEFMAGVPKAIKHMLEYNVQDVLLLERVYDLMLPWIDNHPNLALYAGAGNYERVCPKCGHDALIKDGVKYTGVSAFQAWKCKRCRGYSRTRLSDMNKHTRPQLVPAAR